MLVGKDMLKTEQVNLVQCRSISLISNIYSWLLSSITLVTVFTSITNRLLLDLHDNYFPSLTDLSWPRRSLSNQHPES